MPEEELGLFRLGAASGADIQDVRASSARPSPTAGRND
jgi:hypothetical protein